MAHVTDFPWNSDELDQDDDLGLRGPALALTAPQQFALAAALAGGLEEHGCDHTLRAARRWAAGAGVAWPWLRSQLEDNGGFCDCEVLLNVVVVPDDDPDPD